MISTPVWDFVENYRAGKPARFHMPGHKGHGALGCEAWDITEITGADDLFHAEGIIKESEENASRLFGWPTVYSAEGSSLCIRTMLHLAYTAAGCRGAVLAGRNAHKSFLNTAILLDFPIRWLWAEEDYLSCPITAEQVEAAIREEPEAPCAVYLTSPDYLGNVANIAGIAQVCRRYHVPLLVDNAHGAYLKYLPQSRHPMDLGADMCCDSAHKTLPVLTGGAYLHLRQSSQIGEAKQAMALFASTSPSYLILQSLDLANPYMEHLPEKIRAFLPEVEALRRRLEAKGYTFAGNEPLKLTLTPRGYGYTGTQIGKKLEEKGIFCEFQDDGHIVFLLSVENTREDLQKLAGALEEIPPAQAIREDRTVWDKPVVRMSPRQAAFAPHENLDTRQCAGRILATANVSCPPAVPLVMCGEEIPESLIPQLLACGGEKLTVVKD